MVTLNISAGALFALGVFAGIIVGAVALFVTAYFMQKRNK